MSHGPAVVTRAPAGLRALQEWLLLSALGSAHAGSIAGLVVAQSKGRPWHAAAAAGDFILARHSQF